MGLCPQFEGHQVSGKGQFIGMGSLRASTLLLATLLVGLFESCRGLCTRSFFAQPVIYDRAMGIDFYFTGINVATVGACAEFCGARRFCRTAIYNSFTRTCAISYEYTLNCRYNKNRYTDFDVRRTTSHLIQVACVSKCDNERASHMPIAAPEGAALPETLRKVELITGEPHDGMRGSISSTKQIQMIAQLKMAPEAAQRGFEKRVSMMSSSRTAPEDAFIDSLRKSVLLGVANKVCTEDGKPVGMSRTDEQSTTTLMPTTKPFLNHGDSSEVRTTIWSFLTMPTTTPSTLSSSETVTTTETPTTKTTEVVVDTTTSAAVAEETTKSTESATTTEETTKTTESTSTEATTTTTTDTIPASEPNTASEETKDSREALRTTEAEEEVTSPTTTPSEEETTREIGHDDEDASFEIVKRGCFEEIPGYMMVNVAGGLEHDVSIEECKCFCANSKTSRRYSFDCLSATYYHDERDCILNLDDRNRSPQLLEKQDKLTVTYIGPTCGKDETIASLVNGSLDESCKRTTPAPSTTSAPKKRKTGANSDDCFLEFTDFVLEGTALAIETTITSQECKCRCLKGEDLYGEACQSFEYYFDSNTCLINKQNRFSSPESFNFVSSAQPRSYFEHKCATRDDVRMKYLDDYCSTDANDLQNNNVGVENNPKERENEETPEEVPEASNVPVTSTSGAQITDAKHEEVQKPASTKKSPLIEGDAGHVKKTTESPFPTMVTMVYNRNETEPPNWNSDIRHKAKLQQAEKLRQQELAKKVYEIPEAESEEGQPHWKRTRRPRTTTPSTPRPMLKRYVVRAYVNKNIPETDGLDEREFDKIVELELPADYKGDPNAFVPPVDSEDVVVRWPSRLSGVRSVKFDTKKKKWQDEETTTTTSTTTTTTTTTTKAPDFTPPSALVYPSVGRCTYSAMYQTAFQGTKLIRSIYVKSPADCFAACYAHGCRSANLISSGAMNTCDLFRDSIIDYRSIGMIAYDGSTVYFDGIKCDGPS
ncbi:hypothetical protein Y032_0542g3218 [Ancylostoma ceylanicum]|uniref:Apple domain-containing protein n=2 Tax=Ancylostoma ceylanicum TaxID=53326 RepID=A0A016WS77_9BILA|nr:hypothetical protein Y032_0542g3218 [Ancylostoma ceylanicum]